MLMPALSKAREKAETISCVNNLKQLDMAIIMYTTSSKSAFPHWSWSDNRLSDGGTYAKIWMHAAYENSGEEKAFQCPVNEKTINTDDDFRNPQGYYVNGTTIKDDKEHPNIYPSYGFNDHLAKDGLKTSNIRKPSKSVMLGDCYHMCGGEGWKGSAFDNFGYLMRYNWAGTPGDWAHGDYSVKTLHGKARNMAFVDGHVDTVNWQENRCSTYDGTLRYGYDELTRD